MTDEPDEELPVDLDLGAGHTLCWLRWAPDRDLNPQYVGLPDVDRYGAIVGHPVGPHPLVPGHRSTGLCEGAVVFAGEVQQRIEPDRPTWTVESWDPLTISPSLLCPCGDHGFVKDGRWVPA